MKSKILFLFFIFIFLASCDSPLPDEMEILPTETSAIEPTVEELSTEMPLPDILEGSIMLTGSGEEVTITKLVEINSQVRWAVGSRANGPNMVLYSSDGSQSWADRTPPIGSLDPDSQEEAISAFWDASTGWVIYTGSNLIWKTTDAGLTWIPNTLAATGTLGGMIYILNQDTAWVMLFSYVGGPRNADITLYRTLDGGMKWELMLDPSNFGSIVHGFTKTGFSFGSPEYGWITRDTMGFYAEPPLDITRDGGKTWDILSFPPPVAYPDLFMDCGCGAYNPDVAAPGVGSFRLSCNCLGEESYQYTVFDYQTFDEGRIWIISAIEE